MKILGIDVQKSYAEIVVPKNKEIPSEAEIKQILGVIPRKIKIRKLKQSRKVTWRIRIFSRILCRLFKSLFWYFQESSDKEVKLNFLKGLLAAEGCVGLRKDGFVHNIYFSQKRKGERSYKRAFS